MAYRWMTCPLIEIEATDTESGVVDRYLAPKVAAHIEPGRGKRYQYSAVADVESADWCLVLVKATAWGPLLVDGEIEDVVEGAFDDAAALLDGSPRSHGWNTARLNRLRGRLNAKGVAHIDLTEDDALETWLDRFGQGVQATFQARHIRV